MTRRKQRWLGTVVLLVAAVAAMAVTPDSSARHAGGPTRWCGALATADEPDSASAFLIHVVYATPADAPDRFAERLLPILSDLSSAESWWERQDPSRNLRFDLLVGDCDSNLGKLDLTQVRLPHDGAYYADPREGFKRITADVEVKLLASNTAEKKYLVYYDGPSVNRICGISPLGPARSSATSIVFLGSACGDDLGLAGKAAAVAVHELLHSLAAYPKAHGCTGDRAHACDDPTDILYPTVENGTLLDRLLLDVGRDDYYGLTGSTGGWWDVRTSPFLEHLDAPSLHEPAGLSSLSAVTRASRVTLGWNPTRTGGDQRYRVYRDGGLIADTTRFTVVDTAQAGATVIYSVRVTNSYGYLSSPQLVRVLVGTGVVDEHGEPVRDTTPPSQVKGLRASRRADGAVVLHWKAVDDPGDLAGYRVYRNDRALGRLSLSVSLAVSPAGARAKWAIAAVDTSGNVGLRSQPIRVA